MSCLYCSNWGCRRCKPPHEVAAAGGGDNGLTAAELEVVALRNRVAELEAERKRMVPSSMVASMADLLAECREWMRSQLPTGSGGGLDSSKNNAREAILARISEALR